MNKNYEIPRIDFVEIAIDDVITFSMMGVFEPFEDGTVSGGKTKEVNVDQLFGF